MIAAGGLEDTDPGRRNMWLLVQLRWIAVGGQLGTIGFVHFVMGVHLPLVPLFIAPLMLAGINLATYPLLDRRAAITNWELTVAMLADVAALAWQLHFTGGLANPFASLFLLQVVTGAMLLQPGSSWMIVGAASLALFAVAISPVPLDLPTGVNDPFRLYLAGSLICFALIAVLLVLLITRIARNLREGDAERAAIRQRAAEEDHIVRMGLLATGAAHELGTPLSSLSVILGDWQRMPRIAGDRDLAQDVADMQAEVARCKTIVSGILLSAGEARGIASEFTTVRRFLDAVVAEWRASRLTGMLDYADGFGPDMPIVADPALRQVLSNVIDNAAEVSPDWIGIAASRDRDDLVIEISDRGPGFAPEMLAGFGQPYRSSKGKPGGGLGLFLLVNVLRKLGGAASAENRPGGGALVRIRLPLDAIARPGEEQA
ncbi:MULTISPECIES: ATP-binding protein [Sphingomonas]|uniref:histidine kinase n=1 Tax=Sphingomonas leidyi TaxID=68569 RepID=A0A7X5V2B5_9SPHN|nr:MULTISPECIES: ATP-binding protein [Sphingomonas]MBN8813568.1 HAMP domain-containing histidine kinase [Sphingomonas sp.]NIJ66605.1 two-component system sensor histidine kinase RegB [Sphingomonas leidyi]OJY52298.1 MAG: histidine kinase [Sphingomonas sp. 67-41]